MTLCLAQSLVDRNGVFDAEDQVEKYVRWYEQGYMSAIGRCFDIGNATRIALETWKSHVGQAGGLERGQVAINKSLNHKVRSALSTTSPTQLTS